MYIKNFHIEEFGPLENIKVENLPPTMAVFLGDNEAGKSSSMEFIRSMLTGIPNRRDLFFQSLKKFKGGTLRLDDEKYGEMLVERNFSARSNRNLKIYNGSKKKIENSVFYDAIDNISQDVYRLIFGFNLAELQNFSAFQDTNIFENILGASYGLGLITPDLALQKIQEKMEHFYKAKGKNSVLQNLFTEWKEENALFEKTNQRIEKFDDLQQKLESATLSYEELKQERNNIKTHEEELRTFITLWGQWKKWADLQQEFIQMKAITGDVFAGQPENAEILFTKILEQRRIKQEYLTSLQNSQQKIELSLKTFNIRTGLISQYLPVKDLHPKFLEASKIVAEIPTQKVQIEQSFLALTKQNKKILDTWITFNPSPRVQHFVKPEQLLAYFQPVLEDSLFLEDLEKFVSQIRDAKAHIQNAKTALEYAKRDADKARLKYQAVLQEKPDANKFDKNSLLNEDEIAFEQELQLWQNRLQETQEKENSYLDISTTKCTDFLNQAKALGFTVLQNSDINKDNAKEFLNNYMQLAQTVRDIHSKEEEILATVKCYEETKLNLQNQEQSYQEKIAQTKQANEQDKKRIEKINAIEKATNNIIQQLEQLEKAEQNQDAEEPAPEMPKWAAVPAVLCTVSAVILFLLRIGSSSPQVTTFWGALNIPYALPLILFLSGLGQGAFLWYIKRKNTKNIQAQEADNSSHKSANEQIELLVHDLQELQTIQEKLLQNFYPEQTKEKKDELNNTLDLLHFDKELSLKIDEPNHSWLSQVIAKAKEKDSLYSHYAKKFAMDTPPANEEAPSSLADLQAQAKELETQLQNLLKGTECSIELAQIPNFVKMIARLDLIVEDINTMSVNVRECHDLYTQFMQWLEEKIPALFEKLSPLSTDDYLQHLIDYRHTIREEQFKHIQEIHGAIFAESLASFEESTEHYAQVEKSLAERKAALEKIYQALADFLQKNKFLFEENNAEFVHTLCNEEQEQDIFTGTFANIKQCVELLYQIHTLYTEQEERKAQLNTQYDALKDFIEPLRTILMRTDFTPKTTIYDESDYIQIYQDLSAEMEKEYALFQQKENLLKEYEQAKENYTKAKQEVQEVENTLQELYDSANVENENELRALLAKIKESERYTQQAIIIEESLKEEALPHYLTKSANPGKREYKELPNQEPLPEIFAYFDENAKIRFEKELQELQEEYAGLDRIEKHIQNLKGQVEAESSYVYEESLSNEAGYRMKKTERAIKDNYNQWLEYAFAKEVLERAKKQYEENSQPQIVQIASAFFNKITDNAWQSIKVNLDDRSVNVLDENGKLLQAEMLSQGAKEQLYLSLRLAHIKNRSLTKRPLPILMDDILVNFDERRMKNTAEVLKLMVQKNPQEPLQENLQENQLEPLSTHNNQQILYYTCHERTAQILQEIIPDTKIYHVQNKKIYETA